MRIFAINSLKETRGVPVSKTFKILTPRGLEIFVTLTQNEDGRLLMYAEIPKKGISGNFLSCNRMPEPKHGATHFIEINYSTAVGLDDANTKILKTEIADMKAKMEESSKSSSRSRK